MVLDRLESVSLSKFFRQHKYRSLHHDKLVVTNVQLLLCEGEGPQHRDADPLEKSNIIICMRNVHRSTFTWSNELVLCLKLSILDHGFLNKKPYQILLNNNMNPNGYSTIISKEVITVFSFPTCSRRDVSIHFMCLIYQCSSAIS